MGRAASLLPASNEVDVDSARYRANADISAADLIQIRAPKDGGTTAEEVWQPVRDELLQRQILTPAHR
jgi:hypothetical protein